MDKLEEEIKKLREEIDKYRGHGVNNENNREKILKKLNDELSQTENETAEYEKQYQETMKTINALKVGIHSIFERVGCSQDSYVELMGSTGVTESNMMHYLGAIEQRTNEILQMYSACQQKGGIDTQPPVSPNIGPNRDQKQDDHKFEIAAPEVLSNVDDEDKREEEDDTRRLTIKEFKERAERFALENKSLGKKDKNKGSKTNK